MKNIIETSVYLYILAFICFISVQFIFMNEKVTKVNEVSTYIENYIEAKGICKTDEDGNILYYKYDENSDVVPATVSDVTSDIVTTFPVLPENVENGLKQTVNNYGFDVEFTYTDVTQTYVYIEYKITYTLTHEMLDFAKTHTYAGLARFSLIG